MKYAEMGRALGELTQEKNEAYGDSFEKSGEVLVLLYPSGIRPEQYRDALAIVRVVDKLFRIATRKEAFGESPWKDIAGYGILGAVADETGLEKEQTVEPWQPKVNDRVVIKGGVHALDIGTVGTVKEILAEDESYPYRVSFGHKNNESLGVFMLSELAPAPEPPSYDYSQPMSPEIG